jgi:periplasmic protein TonB
VSAARRIGPGDRLGATLALSLIAHGVFALGVGFAIEDPAPLVPTLDIILTQTSSAEKPKQADYLAQSSQQGGGESDTPDRPREPQPAPVPKPERGLAPAPIQASAPRPQAEQRQPVLTTTQRDPRRADNRELTPTPTTSLPSNRQLIERSLEMARLAAELERQTQAYAKRPKRKFVSASTQEYEFASYMRGWVARVERIGNLNYPDDARRRNLQGQLVMTVAVRRDGSVESIDIVQPSGHPILDEAAVRTVRLAEPFGPLPDTKERVDVLHITRTWQFLPGNVMRNQ